MANLNTCTILTHGFTQTVFNRTLMANWRHIDKIDNDQATQVTQAQLAGNFVSGFKVGVKRRFFNVAAARGACRVDVNGGQRFGGVDNNRAAGRKTHFALEGRFNLRLDLIVAEQRNFTGVQFDFAAEIRTAQRGNMLTSQLQHFRVVDQNFADVLAQIITESTNDNVTFLMDKERCRTAFRRLFNRFPVLHTEAEIPLKCLSRFTHTRGADDQAHTVWQFQCGKRLFQFGTVIAFDSARNAASTGVVWHQNQVTSCQTDKGSQSSAFIAAFFFIDLYNDFLTFTQDILNVRTAMGVVVGREVFAGNFFQR